MLCVVTTRADLTVLIDVFMYFHEIFNLLLFLIYFCNPAIGQRRIYHE